MRKTKNWFKDLSRLGQAIAVVGLLVALSGSGVLGLKTTLTASHSNTGTTKSPIKTKETKPPTHIPTPAKTTPLATPAASTEQPTVSAPITTPTTPVSSTPTVTVPTQPTVNPTDTNQQAQTPIVQAVSCNENLKTSYTSFYNTMVAAENIRHTNAISQIGDSWNARGMLFSGGYEADINAENQQNQVNLAQLALTYNEQLASINC